jgi:hypothetical protein
MSSISIPDQHLEFQKAGNSVSCSRVRKDYPTGVMNQGVLEDLTDFA